MCIKLYTYIDGVQVLGMEVTASCEGGQRWTGRPPTPVFRANSEHVSASAAPYYDQANPAIVKEISKKRNTLKNI